MSVRASLESGYERAAEWLIESCRINSFRGSSAWQSRFFHPLRLWSYPYPETSGYLIPTFYDYIAWGGKFSRDAQECIDSIVTWLLSMQLPSGAFPAGHCAGYDKYLHTSKDYLLRQSRPATPSVFNSGQILLGLVRHYRETEDRGVGEAIVKCGGYLASSVDEHGAWSGDSYAKECSPAYFTHVSWPLLEAWNLTGDRSYKEKAILSLEKVLSGFDCRTGFIDGMGFQASDFAHTHTIGYTLCGLLQSARVVGEEGNRFGDAARTALAKLFRTAELRKKMPGGFGAHWKPDWSYICITGDCQIALCFLNVFELDNDIRYLNASCRLHRTAVSAQAENGGLPGSIPRRGKYMSLRYPNWTAKYFMDLSLKLMGILTSQKQQCVMS